MKNLFATFAALAMVGLMAVSCKEDNNKPDTGISIKFAPTELSLMEGAISDPIAVTVVPENRASELKWFVSDQTIADIDVNTLKVKALKEGTCTITAKLFDANNKAEATADLKVTVAPNVNNQITNVIIKPEKVVLAPQETKDITISILPEGAKHGDIVVASTDDKIAKVTNKKDNVFTITANAVGNVTITATVGDKAGKCEVEVKEGGADQKGKIVKDFYFWDLASDFDIADIKKAEEKIGRELDGKPAEKDGILSYYFHFLNPASKDAFILGTFQIDCTVEQGTQDWQGHRTEIAMMNYDKDYGDGIDLTQPLEFGTDNKITPSENAYLNFLANYFEVEISNNTIYGVYMRDKEGNKMRRIAFQTEPSIAKHYILPMEEFESGGKRILSMLYIPAISLKPAESVRSHGGLRMLQFKAPYEYVLFSNILK